jgi:hypothetical protein
MLAFYSGVSALVLVVLAGCASGGNCVPLGDDDPLKDVDRLTEFSRAVKVAVTEREAVFIVGGALAVKHVEGAEVHACIRVGSDGKVEYRLVASNGTVVGWRSPPAPLSNAR